MKLRYVELPTERIFNNLGIENKIAWMHLSRAFNTPLAGIWWTPKGIELRRLFAELWIEEFDKLTNHFTLLRESIAKSGIQRPVSAISGPHRDKFLANPQLNVPYFPPPEMTPIHEVVYTQPFGGSRVTVAQELGIKMVPCAVHDFSNLFPKAVEITPQNIRQWFGTEYVYTRGLPHLRVRNHSHIRDPKYRSMNQQTRKAQGIAAEKAKARIKEMGEGLV